MKKASLSGNDGSRSRLAKLLTVGALTVAAFGVAAPSAIASNESNWTYGCRGYWYETAGHAYCKGATQYGWYNVKYDCTSEGDSYGGANLAKGYVGKFDRFECIFDIDHTYVTKKV
ncbi:hypothetical protein ACIBQ5_06865 [Streptomyces massasporeus]|uniref:hypothetical protein n=1 Tax=Streptomyces massasporeus TaxID=67324 RepID=UPI0037AF3C2D